MLVGIFNFSQKTSFNRVQREGEFRLSRISNLLDENVLVVVKNHRGERGVLGSP